MKKLLFILIIACMSYSETFYNFDYEIAYQNDELVAVELYSEEVNVKIIMDLILEAEKEFPIKFMCMITPNVYLFRKVKK